MDTSFEKPTGKSPPTTPAKEKKPTLTQRLLQKRLNTPRSAALQKLESRSRDFENSLNSRLDKFDIDSEASPGGKARKEKNTQNVRDKYKNI